MTTMPEQIEPFGAATSQKFEADELDVAIYRKRRDGEACDARHDPDSVCRGCYGTDVVGGWREPQHGTARRVVISYDRWPDIPSENWWTCDFYVPFTAVVAPQDLVVLGEDLWTVVHVESSTYSTADEDLEGWRVQARSLDDFEPGMRFLKDRKASP